MLRNNKISKVALNPLFGAAPIPANIVSSLPLHTMYLPLYYTAPSVVPLECCRLFHIFFFSMRSAGFLTMTVDDTNSYLVTGDADGVIKVWDIAEYCVGNMVNNDTPPRKFAVNYGEKRPFLHFESVAKCKT